MKEYIVIDNPPNYGGCEKILNEHAEEGWVMVGFSQYQLVMERDKTNEDKSIEQICG